jgi:hypothetical protein
VSRAALTLAGPQAEAPRRSTATRCADHGEQGFCECECECVRWGGLHGPSDECDDGEHIAHRRLHRLGFRVARLHHEAQSVHGCPQGIRWCPEARRRLSVQASEWGTNIGCSYSRAVLYRFGSVPQQQLRLSMGDQNGGSLTTHRPNCRTVTGYRER